MTDPIAPHSNMSSITEYNSQYEKGDNFDDSSNMDSEEFLLSDHSNNQYTKRESRRLRSALVLYLSLILLALNVMWSGFLVFGVSKTSGSVIGPNMIKSPARSAVRYEKVTTNSTVYNTNEFRGRPSPEVTEAWHHAYTEWAHIVVPKEDMDAIGRESIPLADGSGVLATLDVFHQIHCLNTIREYIFRDYYWSKELDDRRWEHVDHCIDTLRLAAMCQGDIALVPFQWQDDEVFPAAQFHTEHECRNWDTILEWAQARQADMSLVVRPN